MLPGQMQPCQLASVKDCPWSLPLKLGKNWVSNSWDIPDMYKCRQDKCYLDKCQSSALRLGQAEQYDFHFETKNYNDFSITLKLRVPIFHCYYHSLHFQLLNILTISDNGVHHQHPLQSSHVVHLDCFLSSSKLQGGDCCYLASVDGACCSQCHTWQWSRGQWGR